MEPEKLIVTSNPVFEERPNGHKSARLTFRRRKVLVETGERLSPSSGEQLAVQNGGDTPRPEPPETEHLAA
jgi:hypothetical protein